MCRLTDQKSIIEVCNAVYNSLWKSKFYLPSLLLCLEHNRHLYLLSEWMCPSYLQIDSACNVKSNRVERGWGKGEDRDIGTYLNSATQPSHMGFWYELKVVKAAIETKSLAWGKSQLANVNCNTLMIPLLPKNRKNLPSKTGIGHALLPAGGTLSSSGPEICVQNNFLCSGLENTQLSHRRSYRLSIRIYLNRPAPCDKWPTEKDKWSPALGKLFSENNSALWVLSVRIPGEGKWIVSQGEKTHRSEDCCENCGWGGFKEESITDGWRVSNVRFYRGNLCSSN